jgi:hypothetical protein
MYRDWKSRLQGYFRNSLHDPGLTLRDENAVAIPDRASGNPRLQGYFRNSHSHIRRSQRSMMQPFPSVTPATYAELAYFWM